MENYYLNRILFTNALIQDVDADWLRVVDVVHVVSGHVEQAVLIENRLVDDARVLVEAVVANVGDQVGRRVQNETRLGVTVRLNVLEYKRSGQNVHVDHLIRIGTEQVVIGAVVVFAANHSSLNELTFIYLFLIFVK